VELWKTLLLPLDDLLQVVHEFIHPEVSRSSIIRLLRRYELTPLWERIWEMIPKEDSEEEPPKSFKDNLPGYLHADVKHLPQIPDEESRKYLFVAIDRATCWVYLEVLPDKSAQSAKQFLDHLVDACPIQVEIVLTAMERSSLTASREAENGNPPVTSLSINNVKSMKSIIALSSPDALKPMGWWSISTGGLRRS